MPRSIGRAHRCLCCSLFKRTFRLRNEFEDLKALRTSERFANADWLAINVVLPPLLMI